MKKLLTVLAFFMALSTFAGNHEKFVGDWAFNVDKFKQTKEFQEAAKNPQAGPMMNMMLGMLSSMKFNITANELNTTAKTPAGDQTKKATYTIAADNDNTLEIKIKSSKEGQESIMVIEFIDDKNITMTPKTKLPGPMQKMFLIKK